MTYETWHIIYYVSGVLTLLFFILTLIFIIAFRFFDLVKFSISQRKKHTSASSAYIPDSDEISSVTEKLSDTPVSDQYEFQNSTVVVTSEKEKVPASDSRFEITLDILVACGDWSDIEG